MASAPLPDEVEMTFLAICCLMLGLTVGFIVGVIALASVEWTRRDKFMGWQPQCKSELDPYNVKVPKGGTGVQR